MKEPTHKESDDLMRDIKIVAQDFYADNIRKFAVPLVAIETAVMIGVSLALRATPGQKRSFIASRKAEAHKRGVPVPKNAPHGDVGATMRDVVAQDEPKCGTWTVIDTPCRPRRWKVVNPCYRPNNSWTEYFRDRLDAENEAVRRNVDESD